jgi:enhancer of mRNA-decapping protein 4
MKDMDKKSAANKKTLEASLQAAVKDSVRTILPKEVFGAVKTGMDKQLASAVQQGLSSSIQDSFKQSFMKQLVPAFEAACQNMLNQFDATLKTHLNEVTKEAKNSLSSVAKAAATAAASATAARPATSGQGHSGQGTQSPHSVQSTASPKEEILNLLRSGNLEQAFRKALSLQDLGILGWLCASVDAPSTLARTPTPLSQMVLLSLLQQLAHDLSQQTTSKLQWIREAALVINPQDPAISHQVKPVLQGVANSLTTTMQKMSPADASSCKLTIHVVRSQMVA